MEDTLLLLPVFTSFIFWLTFKLSIKYIFTPVKARNIAGIKIQGLLAKNKAAVIEAAAKELSHLISNSSFITDKLTGAETLQKVMPAIDAHIDDFLNHKLKEAIPVISMFIGDKITLQLKDLFLKELEELFPSVMSQFIANWSQNDDLEKEIIIKLQEISIESAEKLFYKTFQKELRKGALLIGAVGLVAGVIQMILTLLLLK